MIKLNEHIEQGNEVFIYCSLGESRSPSIALMYLLENNLIEKSENTFNIFKQEYYPNYLPKIVNELQKNNLIDEYIISVIPILLGDGIRLFKDGRPEQKLELVDAKQYESGLTQLHYTRKGN